jgi:hypothetical protein
MVTSTRPARIVFVCRINHNNTSKLEANFQMTQIDHNTPVCYDMSVDNMFVNMPEFLAENALPCTKEGAALLLKLKLPAADEVTSAIATNVKSVNCLTEDPSMLAACIKANCIFYVLTGKPIGSKMLDQITAPLGTLIISPEWGNLKTKITGPLRVLQYDDMGRVTSQTIEKDHVFTGNDSLRDSTQGVCTDSAYVYAVRPDIKSSAGRACNNIKIFNEGGVYDKMGYPIITNAAAVATTSSTTTTSTTAPLMITGEPPSKKGIVTDIN